MTVCIRIYNSCVHYVTSLYNIIIQYSEANDYSEQKLKAVESLHNKVSHAMLQYSITSDLC